jgi:hypothetical protein
MSLILGQIMTVILSLSHASHASTLETPVQTQKPENQSYFSDRLTNSFDITPVGKRPVVLEGDLPRPLEPVSQIHENGSSERDRQAAAKKQWDAYNRATEKSEAYKNSAPESAERGYR